MRYFEFDLASALANAGITTEELAEKLGAAGYKTMLDKWCAEKRYGNTAWIRDVLGALDIPVDDDDVPYKWFALVKSTMYFDSVRDIRSGASLDDENAKTISIFKSKEEAFAALANYESEVYPESTFYGKQYSLTEWSIEEYEGGQDGEHWGGADFQPCKMQEEFSERGKTYRYDTEKDMYIELPDEDEED